jgi:hypothetical protein
VVAVAGLTAASCSGGENAGSTTVAPTTEVVTTTAAPTTTKASTVTTAPVLPNMKPDEIAVRNLLDIFQAETTEVYADPDPTRASLLAILASPYKEHLVGVITDYRNEGSYFKRASEGVPPHRVNSVNFSSPDSAVAIECLNDDRFTYKRGVEQPVDTSISRLAFRTSINRDADGQWRISDKLGLTPEETAARCAGL